MKHEDSAAIIEKYILERSLVFKKATKGDHIEFDGEAVGIFGSGNVRVVLSVFDDYIASCTYFPPADKNSVAETAKYLSVVNKSVPLGYFAVDWDNANILFRLSYPVRVLQTDDANDFVHRLIHLPYSIYYTHRKAIAAVSSGQATAEEAVKKEREWVASFFNSTVGHADGKDNEK